MELIYIRREKEGKQKEVNCLTTLSAAFFFFLNHTQPEGQSRFIAPKKGALKFGELLNVPVSSHGGTES